MKVLNFSANDINALTNLEQNFDKNNFDAGDCEQEFDDNVQTRKKVIASSNSFCVFVCA